jgi:hypothetical protein
MVSKHTGSYVISPEGPIKARDIDYKVIQEDWNIYELEDGTILKAKLVVSKIQRGIDPDTNEIYYLPGRGEPLYNIRNTVVVSAEVPDDLLKEPDSKEVKIN